MRDAVRYRSIDLRQRLRRRRPDDGFESPPTDRFAPLVVAIRWAILTAGLILGLPSSVHGGFVVATVVLLVNNSWRSLKPLSVIENRALNDALLLLDLVVAMFAVVVSGGAGSPYVFIPVADVFLAGFARGYLDSLAVAGIAAISLGAIEVVTNISGPALQPLAQVTTVYLIAAAVAGYAHRLFTEVEERQEVAADIVSHLTEANELLSDLHRVARTLPSSLDLGDTLASAIARFHGLFDFTAIAVLVLDPATGTWRSEAVEGVRLPPEMAKSGLPWPLVDLVGTPETTVHEDLSAGGGVGLLRAARSALYAPLVAREHLVGLVALEHTEPGRFGARDVRLMSGLGEPLALAIDNALWFSRLRILGAEGERTRIARNLHDGIGQGLAYIALELDRIGKKSADPDVVRLRDDTRSLLRDVRETLHQLRSEVTESVDLRSLAETYVERFSERTGIDTSLVVDGGDSRLPVPVERELWRVLQEALLNVERHSGANKARVTWRTDGRHGYLDIRDDGRGFDLDVMRARAASGMVTMRERANAIGGRLMVQTAPGQGTNVTVEVEVGQ